jgi:hypothetical protein
MIQQERLFWYIPAKARAYAEAHRLPLRNAYTNNILTGQGWVISQNAPLVESQAMPGVYSLLRGIKDKTKLGDAGQDVVNAFLASKGRNLEISVTREAQLLCDTRSRGVPLEIKTENVPHPNLFVQVAERRIKAGDPGFVGYDKDGHFVHYCHCGEWGAFGYNTNRRIEPPELGQWYCSLHKPDPEVEAMVQAMGEIYDNEGGTKGATPARDASGND